MREHRHPTGAFSVALPDDWSVQTDVERVALLAIDPTEDFGFHPNLVVTIEAPADGTDIERWFADQPRVLTSVLEDAHLIDVAVADLAGHPALRMLVHHRVDGAPVTMEQWAALIGGFGWFVTGSVASLSYDHLADHFETSVASLRIHDVEDGQP